MVKWRIVLAGLLGGSVHSFVWALIDLHFDSAVHFARTCKWIREYECVTCVRLEMRGAEVCILSRLHSSHWGLSTCCRGEEIFFSTVSVSVNTKDISAKLLHLQQAYFSWVISLKTWSESWWCRDCVYYTHAKNAMRLSGFSRSPEDLKCCLEHTHTHTHTHTRLPQYLNGEIPLNMGFHTFSCLRRGTSTKLLLVIF